MNGDLISRSALLKELSKGTIITDILYGMGIMAGDDHAMKKIKEAPAVDAVEVVRCRDCKHFKRTLENDTYCQTVNGMTDPEEDDFCSYGERRSDHD